MVKGSGWIEHFGVRAPALFDKRTVGQIPPRLPLEKEDMREIQAEWGFRASLILPANQNCWLIGAGSAKFEASHLALAYLNFPAMEAANAGLGTRHRMHFHQRSWEYYVVLAGAKTLQIEDERVTIQAGEVLEVPPEIRHKLHSRQAPFEGFTFRVPLELDDKIES